MCKGSIVGAVTDDFGFQAEVQRLLAEEEFRAYILAELEAHQPEAAEIYRQAKAEGIPTAYRLIEDPLGFQIVLMVDGVDFATIDAPPDGRWRLPPAGPVIGS
jgi:hypothetical protein